MKKVGLKVGDRIIVTARGLRSFGMHGTVKEINGDRVNVMLDGFSEDEVIPYSILDIKKESNRAKVDKEMNVLEKRSPRVAAEVTKVLEEIIEPEPPKDCKYPEIWYHARERVRESGEPVTKGEVKKVFDDLVKPLDKTAEADTSKPWGVFLSGGSLGEQRGLFDSRYGKLVGSYDTESSAQLIASSRNHSLSTGEKSYYKMKYRAKPIEKEKLVQRGSKEAYLTPPSWVKQPDVWNNVMRMLEIKGPVDYGAAVAYYKNKCKKMNLVAGEAKKIVADLTNQQLRDLFKGKDRGFFEEVVVALYNKFPSARWTIENYAKVACKSMNLGVELSPRELAKKAKINPNVEHLGQESTFLDAYHHGLITPEIQEEWIKYLGGYSTTVLDKSRGQWAGFLDYLREHYY